MPNPPAPPFYRLGMTDGDGNPLSTSPVDLYNQGVQKGLSECSGAPGVCQWVLEHEWDWAREPATDLAAIATPTGAPFVDRFGISWLVWSGGTLVPGDIFALVPGGGLVWDIAPWDIAAFKDGGLIFDIANTSMAAVIALGGGPPFQPTDPIWIVYHWDNIDYPTAAWSGFSGGMDSGTVYAPDPMWLESSAGVSPRRSHFFPGDFFIEIGAGDPLGFNYGQFAHAPDVECFIGCESTPFGTGLRYGTTRPSVPEDLGVVDTSEFFSHSKAFNDPVYQLQDGPGPMPDFYAFTYGLLVPVTGRMTCRLRSIRVYRWRIP